MIAAFRASRERRWASRPARGVALRSCRSHGGVERPPAATTIIAVRRGQYSRIAVKRDSELATFFETRPDQFVRVTREETRDCWSCALALARVPRRAGPPGDKPREDAGDVLHCVPRSVAVRLQ